MLYPRLNTEQFVQHGATRSDRWLILLSKIVDISIIVGVLLLSVTSYRPSWDSNYSMAALLASIFFFVFAEVSGIYRPWRGETLKRQFFEILSAWLEAFFLLLLLAYALKTSDFYSRVAIGIWLVTTPFLLSAWRVAARTTYKRIAVQEHHQRNALVWGTGELGEQLAYKIRKSPWLGLRLVDYVCDPHAECSDSIPPQTQHIDSNSNLSLLELRARRGDFDILYIALPTTARLRITELIDRLADTTVSVYMVPDYFTSSLFHGKWSNLDGIPLVSIYDTPFWGVDGWVKRAEDIILSSVFLFVSSLPMLLIAAAIKLTSPGPALFKQRRYGMRAEEICVWKFRSMHVCEDGTSVPQAQRNDPRVTRLGAFLRHTSLDELPQLINVLMGQMSVVGPRPHAIAHNEFYRSQVKGYMLRHTVRPGITGWAQVNGWRGETNTLDKMKMRIEHDLWYIHNWSLWLDLKIILLTVVRGFSSNNAY